MGDPNPGPNIDTGLERFWQELRGKDHAEVCAGAGVSFDGGRYTVPFLGSEYQVDPRLARISGPAGDTLSEDREFQLMILGYLACARGSDSPPPAVRPDRAGGWVSERQLPGGSLFFQGPHALPLGPILARFGSDAAGFRRTCTLLGGTAVGFGDAAFYFAALPLVPLAVVLWIADDEFPARAGVLFDPSAATHLALDLILALVRSTILRIEAVSSTIP